MSHRSPDVSDFSGKKFQYPLRWGDDFKVEHENALLDQFSGRPVVVTHFPATIKPFYMEKRTGTHGTVAECFDLLLPVGGEAVGGSMRETNHTNLVEAIKKAGVSGLDWYVRSSDSRNSFTRLPPN